MESIYIKTIIFGGIDYKNRRFLWGFKLNRTLDDGIHERDVYLGVLEYMGFKTQIKSLVMFLADQEKTWSAKRIKDNRETDKKLIAVFAGGGNNSGTFMPLKNE